MSYTNSTGQPGTSTGVTFPAAEVAAMVASAAGEGVKLAAADTAYDAILGILNTLLEDVPVLGFLISTDSLPSQVFKTLVVPYLVILLCKMYPNNIPNAALVSRGAMLVVEARSFRYVGPLFHKLTAPLQKLAEAATQLGSVQAA